MVGGGRQRLSPLAQSAGAERLDQVKGMCAGFACGRLESLLTSLRAAPRDREAEIEDSAAPRCGTGRDQGAPLRPLPRLYPRRRRPPLSSRRRRRAQGLPFVAPSSLESFLAAYGFSPLRTFRSQSRRPSFTHHRPPSSAAWHSSAHHLQPGSAFLSLSARRLLPSNAIPPPFAKLLPFSASVSWASGSLEEHRVDPRVD
jgi:hypothetical protein